MFLVTEIYRNDGRKTTAQIANYHGKGIIEFEETKIADYYRFIFTETELQQWKIENAIETVFDIST